MLVLKLSYYNCLILQFRFYLLRFLAVEDYYVVKFCCFLLKPLVSVDALVRAVNDNSCFTSMQALDLPRGHSTNPVPDPSAMPGSYSPIQCSPEKPANGEAHVGNSSKNGSGGENGVRIGSVGENNGGAAAAGLVARRERPTRACTQRAAERMQAAAEAEAAMAEKERRKKKAKKRERLAARLLREDSDEEEVGATEEEGVKEEENGVEGGGSPSSSRLQYSKLITPLVGELEPSQLPRSNIRSMWQLASILNFLNVCVIFGE